MEEMRTRIQREADACVCDGEPVERAAGEGRGCTGLKGVQDTGEGEVRGDVLFMSRRVEGRERGVVDVEVIVVWEGVCGFERVGACVAFVDFMLD